MAGLPQCSQTGLPGGATLTIVDLAERYDRPACLEVRDLVMHRGRRLVIGWQRGTGAAEIGGLSFSLKEGQLGILEAPNGWGKSSLLECLMGLVPMSGGTITFRSQNIANCSTWERRRLGIGLLGTNRLGFQRLSVGEVMCLAGLVDTPPKLRGLEGRRVGTLSGGEYQSLRVAAALHSGTRLRLLDEPFQMLDGGAIGELITQLRGKTNGATLVMVPKSI
jgi:urea transport system ATP-binding protein